MLRIGSVVWGVRDLSAAIGFWCAALDYRPARPPSNDWAILVPRDGSGQKLAIKLVASEPLAKQRHHLDLYAADQASEVKRLLGLGAVEVDRGYEHGADYVVLADDDGNRFCVIDATATSRIRTDRAERYAPRHISVTPCIRYQVLTRGLSSVGMSACSGGGVTEPLPGR